MAYITGLANNIGELWTALTSGLTSNGWTAAASNIYTKSGVYVKLLQTSNRIEILGGTGESGGALTGAPVPNSPYDGTMSLSPVGTTGFQYPANYYLHIHSSPDEVYFFVNESGTRWSWLAFGKSNVGGLPGSGNWYAATNAHKFDNYNTKSLMLSDGTFNSYHYYSTAALFWDSNASGTPGNGDQPYNSSVHHGFDGNTWSKGGADVGSESFFGWSDSPAQVRILAPIFGLLKAQPNTWNQQSVLLRAQAYVCRGSNKFSLVVDPEHCRYLRNDNYQDGDIITLGSDEWKVYPFIKRDTLNRDGGTNTTHSGTIALAVRYDGP